MLVQLSSLHRLCEPKVSSFRDCLARPSATSSAVHERDRRCHERFPTFDSCTRSRDQLGDAWKFKRHSQSLFHWLGYKLLVIQLTPFKKGPKESSCGYTNLLSPFPSLIEWVSGGHYVYNPTLKRFFLFHFQFPFLLCGFRILHLFYLHFHYYFLFQTQRSVLTPLVFLR